MKAGSWSELMHISNRTDSGSIRSVPELSGAKHKCRVRRSGLSNPFVLFLFSVPLLSLSVRGHHPYNGHKLLPHKHLSIFHKAEQVVGRMSAGVGVVVRVVARREGVWRQGSRRYRHAPDYGAFFTPFPQIARQALGLPYLHRGCVLPHPVRPRCRMWISRGNRRNPAV